MTEIKVPANSQLIHKYTIFVWRHKQGIRLVEGQTIRFSEHRFHCEWVGSSLVRAFFVMLKLKLAGNVYVQLRTKWE